MRITVGSIKWLTTVTGVNIVDDFSQCKTSELFPLTPCFNEQS